MIDEQFFRAAMRFSLLIIFAWSIIRDDSIEPKRKAALIAGVAFMGTHP